MAKAFEVSGSYKMGHTSLKTRATINPRSVQRIEEVPEELPEYSDGILCTVRFITGDHMYTSESYETVKDKWLKALEENHIG